MSSQVRVITTFGLPTSRDIQKFPCQTPGAVVRCYGPTQIRTAYDIQRVLDSGDQGQGSTIVIIDAFTNSSFWA